MTIPPKITVLRANWISERQGQKIQAIIAHDTERPNDKSSSVGYLQRGGELPDGSDRKVSIHVHIAENGDSTIMVPDDKAANHAGYGTLEINSRVYSPDTRFDVNTCTLGFELEHTKGSRDPYPEAQLLSAGYWINTWRDRWGKLELHRHGDIDTKRRTDPIFLTVETLERYAVKAALALAMIPTPEKPINYKTRVPQVVYTARSLNSQFAALRSAPFVLDAGVVVPIGDITGDWAWIATGIGFIPVNTLIKA